MIAEEIPQSNYILETELSILQSSRWGSGVANIKCITIFFLSFSKYWKERELLLITLKLSLSSDGSAAVSADSKLPAEAGYYP